ncbi:hypothetical protein [Candidatus Avelusimicrobium sp.]|uniref:hypothetical protein n=1 Tax=Candidatus Avelusimicrobium sp. TaxID=3048833 RepID=UPI003D7EB4E5
MRIGFLLFILGLSVTASAQMYRVGGTSRASFGSQQAEESASAPATRTFSSYGARQQRTQRSNNSQTTAPTAQSDASATQQTTPATTGNAAPQTPAAGKGSKADQKADKNQNAGPKEGDKKDSGDQQQAQAAAMSQVQAMMNSFGLSAPQTGVPQTTGQKDQKTAGNRGNTSRAGNANASSHRSGSFNKDTSTTTPQVPDMSAIMQAASSGQMPDLSALMGGQSTGKK